MGRESFRLALALLGPPIPAMILGLAPFFGQELLADPARGVLTIFSFGLLGALLVGYPAMFLIGLPSHVGLSRSRKIQLWHYVIAGIVAGLMTALVLSAGDGIFRRDLLPPAWLAH